MFINLANPFHETVIQQNTPPVMLGRYMVS
jgi:hypothetical protein